MAINTARSRIKLTTAFAPDQSRIDRAVIRVRNYPIPREIETIPEAADIQVEDTSELTQQLQKRTYRELSSLLTELASRLDTTRNDLLDGRDRKKDSFVEILSEYPDQVQELLDG